MTIRVPRFAGHLHRHSLDLPCIRAKKISTNGYPSGSKHRKVLEAKLGRKLHHGCEAHHVCEHQWCIEPTHLEEKEMVAHRRAHSLGNKYAVGTVFSDEEIERRRRDGKGLIHNARRGLTSDVIKRRNRVIANNKLAKTVRDNSLLCTSCNRWKPDEEFHRDKNRAHRRGRKYMCIMCRTQGVMP